MNNYYKNQLKDIFVLNGYGFKISNALFNKKEIKK